MSASDTKPEGYELLTPHFREDWGSGFKDIKKAKEVNTYGIEGAGYQKWLKLLK